MVSTVAGVGTPLLDGENARRLSGNENSTTAAAAVTPASPAESISRTGSKTCCFCWCCCCSCSWFVFFINFMSFSQVVVVFHSVVILFPTSRRLCYVLHFRLSHMAVRYLHHLHYHRLHLLLLAQYFILNSRLGCSANAFLHRPFPFLPD